MSLQSNIPIKASQVSPDSPLNGSIVPQLRIPERLRLQVPSLSPEDTGSPAASPFEPTSFRVRQAASERGASLESRVATKPS